MTSKKHYIESAKVLSDTLRPLGLDKSRQVVVELANRLASVYAKDNPRFNRRRFLTACGLTEQEINS